MSADDLARQITDNTEAQSKAAHSAWDRTQANINVMLGQVTALGQAKMMDFFLHNAHEQSGVPMVSRGTLEESLRGMLETKAAVSPPVLAPAVQPTATKNWWVPILVAAGMAVGAAGMAAVGVGYGLTNKNLSSVDQENYRYNYLEARGMHLPPPSGVNGD